jgi:hypothetical protein
MQRSETELAAHMKRQYGVWYENGILVGGVKLFPVTPWTPGISYWSVKQ